MPTLPADINNSQVNPEEDSDEEADFKDAEEQLIEGDGPPSVEDARGDSAAPAEEKGAADMTGETSDDEEYSSSKSGGEESPKSHSAGDDDHQPERNADQDADPDLFTSTFGTNAIQERDEDDGDGTSDADSVARSVAIKTLINVQNQASKPTTISISDTPKSPTKPAAPAKPITTLSHALRTHQKLHKRALYLIPRLPNPVSAGVFDWPARRYWIAVLLPTTKPHNARRERDFVWFRGNRLSTVRTIWSQFQATTMCDSEDLVLLLGCEKVEDTVRAEEMDYFGDKLVVLRAMSKSSPEAKGGGLVDFEEKVGRQEVIVID